MASHLSAIGLPVNDQSEFVALADRVGPLATQIAVEHGAYWQWTSRCGAELWLQTNLANELIGITPCYSGLSRIRVRLTARVARPQDSELDGAFHGWADPTSDDEDLGSYPFVFDAIDFARHGQLTLPTIVEAQIAAFAHELSIFPSLEAYSASQTDELKFAPQSFIPSGLFSAASDETSPPASTAIFTGHVMAAAHKTNPLTDAQYYWAHVDTLGGSFDVVIDPTLCDTVPEVGGILQGSFWLCGRIVEPTG